MKIKSRHYGFREKHVVALYRKQGEWRIYGDCAYYKKDADEELIEEVMEVKKVTRTNVKLGRVRHLDVEVLNLP